jgi:hypothetical protein
MGGAGEALETLPTTQDDADPGVVDDVVAVRRTGRRSKYRREVDVGDAERDQVVQALGRVVKGQVRAELEPIGRDGEPSPRCGEVARAHEAVRC